jgi:hypothetical protein
MMLSNRIMIVGGILALGSLVAGVGQPRGIPQDDLRGSDSPASWAHIRFTRSDLGQTYPPPPNLTSYAFGDSVYVLVIDGHGEAPTYAPVWLYSVRQGDMEVYLMDMQRLPRTATFDLRFALAVLPDTTAGDEKFDGTLKVCPEGDSLEAVFFPLYCPNEGDERLIRTGVRIRGPRR